MAGSITSEQTINGAFGELSIMNLTVPDAGGGVQAVADTIALANVQSVEARVSIDRRDLKLAGSRQTVYKAVGAMGEGSFTIFRVTSEFMNLGVDALTKGRNLDSLGGGRPIANGLQLKIAMRDPEAINGQDEEITLSGVRIWEIPFGFSVDDLVSQTITFTFEGMKTDKTIA